jgi:hypothetical protein
MPEQNTTGTFKAIQLKAHDHAAVDALRTKLSYYRKKQVSLADTVMEGVKLLDNKIEAES